MRTPVFIAIMTLVLVAAVAVGCQTYDFEPVQPLAVAQTTASYSTIGRSLKPNMALLVDKSGSMSQAVPCSGTCTRLSEMKSAMATFLSSSGKAARMSLTFYPVAGGGLCAPASAVAIPFPAGDTDTDLQATANSINTSIQNVAAGGGTPTAQSLTFVGQQAELGATDRDNFILLLTDGLPNCNDANPNDYSVNQTTCKCTDPNPATCAQPGFTKLLCLDKDATVASITALNTQKNIRTIVVGFGADTASGDGPEVLQAMAVAGGFPRKCENGTDAECGTGTCDVTSKTCSPSFYQAGNAADLATVLANIAKKVSQAPCDYLLGVAPSNPDLIAVLVDGAVVPRGTDTWQYLPPGGTAGQFGEVQLVGSLCNRAKSATELDPVDVEIRLLKTF